MFNHILVPLDGSLLAERTIAHAEQFAQVFGGKITVLQVLDPSADHEAPGPIEPLNWQIRKAEADMYLQKTAAKIRERGIQADHALLEGRTSENIIDFAHDADVDLVVLSTHGASGLSRWNMSSVVSKVLEKIYLPVLLIRAYQDAGGPIPVSGEMPAAASTAQGAQLDAAPVVYRRILLPIDSSRRAECALPAATRLVNGQQAEIQTVIFGAVIDPPDLPVPAPYPDDIRQLIDQFMQLSRSAVETYLSELSQRMQVECDLRVVENDNISAALHQLAEQENVDLVVMCAHGRTGGVHWPYGSVARNYLDYGTKNALVIQDVPLSQVHTTAAEQAAIRYGRR